MFANVEIVTMGSRAVARRLALLDDVRALGPLLDVLAGLRDGSYRRKDIRDPFIRLLLRVQASDGGTLTPRQRKYLCRVLTIEETWPFDRMPSEHTLKIAILRALERIGDENATPAVERVATSAKDPEVRHVAQQCAAALRARAVRQ
jgi:hypothetical protein